MGTVLSPEVVAAKSSIDAGYRLITGHSFAESWGAAVAKFGHKLGTPNADDLRALIVGSALLIAAFKGSTSKDGPGGPTNARAASAMLASWLLLAKREGYRDGDKAPAPSNQGANLIVIAIVGILAQAAVIAWLIWRAADLVDRALARDAAEDELLRLHARVAEILEAHKGGEPWTPEELAELQALEDQIAKMQTAVAPAPPTSHEPEAFGAGTVVGIGATVVAIWYLFLRPRRA